MRRKAKGTLIVAGTALLAQGVAIVTAGQHVTGLILIAAGTGLLLIRESSLVKR